MGRGAFPDHVSRNPEELSNVGTVICQMSPVPWVVAPCQGMRDPQLTARLTDRLAGIANSLNASCRPMSSRPAPAHLTLLFIALATNAV